MPLVRIDLIKGKSADYVRAIGAPNDRPDWSFGNGIAQYWWTRSLSFFMYG